MLKFKEYYFLGLVFLLIISGLMTVGLNIASNPNSKLSTDSKAYINSYVSTVNDTYSGNTMDTGVNNLKGGNQISGNLSGSEQTASYSAEYYASLQSKNKITFVFTIIKNMPTFVVTALGLPLTAYSIYINILGWFLVIGAFIAGYLVWKGRI